VQPAGTPLAVPATITGGDGLLNVPSELNAQRDKKIEPADADSLIAALRLIIAALPPNPV
jgi:hypothetical protein